MTANPALASEPPVPARFGDPLKDWPNDDLLVGDEERMDFCRRRPRLARIFDWPEMRVLFLEHDRPSNAARKRSQKNGKIAVACGFLGLALAALLYFFAKVSSQPELVDKVVGGLSAVLIAVVGLVGRSQVLTGAEKRRWLSNRYWTERIRQFHFQWILNTLPKAAAALDDDRALAEWKASRDAAFGDFRRDTKGDLATVFDRLNDDRAEQVVWIDPAWARPAETIEDRPEVGELLAGLRALRLGVQERYTRLKLHSGVFSPKTRLGWLLGASNTLTVLIMLLTVPMGVAHVFGFALSDGKIPWWFLLLGGLSGTFGAAVVSIRVVNEGLLLRTETERYEWYLASVRSIAERFDAAADAPTKVRLMREMERLAYQEMRRFLLAFQAARFVM